MVNRMAYKYREEIVGKRFLSVCGYSKLKLNKISGWGWRAGVIRAASHKDNTNKELQVLVEYDDVDWQRREWISIYKEGAFHVFLVEAGLVWSDRLDPLAVGMSTSLWPGLSFTPLVDTVGMSSYLQPIEFLLDNKLSFREFSRLHPFSGYDRRLALVREHPELQAAVRRWETQQDGQRILLATPSVLVGYRVQVYRAEGTTQWYTAVIVGYNESTKDLTVTDDTVLEEHNEDPCLVQMRLIGDGVVDSIMRGESVGIISRRSRSSAVPSTWPIATQRLNRSIQTSTQSSGSRRPRGCRPARSTTPEHPSPSADTPSPPAPSTPSTPNATQQSPSRSPPQQSSPSSVNSNASTEKDKTEARPGRSRIERRKKATDDAESSPKEDVENKGKKRGIATPSGRASRKKVLEDSNASSKGRRQDEVAPRRGKEEPPPPPEPPEPPAPPEPPEPALKIESPPSPVEEKPSEPVKSTSPPPSPASREELPTEDGRDTSEPPVTSTSIPTAPSTSVEVVAAATVEDDDSRGRMDLASDPATPARFPDDRSDSGLSSLRGGWSGDERSGSRSSALSGPDEPATTTATTATVPGAPDAAKVQPSAAAAAPPVPAPAPAAANDSTVRVWRDPMVYTQGNVHHVDSVQHQSLLMAHPGQPAFAPHPVLHPDILLKQRPPYAPHQFSPLSHELAYRRDLEKRTKEHEERQQKLAAEEAVHQHFAESLRLMQKQQHQQQQQQQQQHMQQQEHQRLREQQQRERERYYAVTTTANRSRPPSASSQHSRTPPAPVKKEPQLSAGLPKMEPNFLPSGFSASNLAYPDMAYLKPKQEPVKNILVSNKSPSGEMVLSNPPPLMSDVKNSVIVKNDTKSPVAHSQSKSHPHPIQHPHPNSPKLPHAHYQGGVPAGHKYEYTRSPSQSPHHLLSHVPAHLEPQNLAGLSKGLSVQHHRGVPPPEHRGYSSKPGYSYQQYPLTNVAPAKPKVSSPAPPHMYGKPSAGIMTGTPVIRSQDNAPAVPLPLTSKAPTSFQPVHGSHRPSPPPAHSRTVPNSASSVPPGAAGMYDPRIYPGIKPLPHHSEVPLGRLSPVPLVSDSLRKQSLPPDLRERNPGEHYLLSPHHLNSLPGFMAHVRQMPSANVASFQTQPLDLGVSSADRASSPKRKGSPYSGPLPLDKKARSDGPSPVQPPSQAQPQPLLSRVCEPSPLIANAATTIQTVINTAAYCPASSSPASLAAPAPGRTASGDGSLRPSSAGSTGASAGGGPSGGPGGGPGGGSPAPGPVLARPPVPSPAHLPARTPPPGSCPSPAASPAPPVPTAATATISATTSITTPVKSVPTADSDKSNSPGLLKTPTAPSYPVHKLKKAWLQRHSGEDVSEDTSDVRGSGSSVTLPVRIDSPVAPVVAPPAPARSTPTPPSSSPSTTSSAKSTVSSLNSVGTMAVNSIRTMKGSPGPKTPRKGADVLLNGHAGKLHSDDTSSSDAEVKTALAKRMPPKVKRKKGGNRRTVNDDSRRKKAQARSESGTESERETASDKDSDSGASSKKTSSNGNATAATKEARKRGRRPKPSKNDLDEEPRPKKPKDEPLTPPRDPFHKPPMAQLKKTGENFLQDGACFEVAPKLAKCRECRWTPNQRSKNMPNIFCRFYAFRRLRYTKNGQLAIAGFSNPIRDASEDDLKLWLPLPDSPPSDLDVETSTFLLTQVGDQFCDLLSQEKEAHEQHMGTDKVIAWKRVVQGVREMCDVCETTLFNFHWACGKCGFVVCLDCYKSRRDGTVKSNRTDVGKDRDDKAWLLCTNRQAHEQEKLMLTQIVAGDSLVKVGLKAHRLRTMCNIPQACGCPLSQAKTTNGLIKDVVKNQLKLEPVNGFVKTECNGYKPEDKNSPLSWLADVALSEDKKKNESVGSESDEDKDANFSTLRELLIRPAHKSNGSRASSPDQPGSPANEESNSSSKGVKRQRVDNNEDGNTGACETSTDGGKGGELKHFVRRYMGGVNFRRGSMPMRVMTLTESQSLYPDVPHSWLCDGKLLKLTDAKNPANYRIFQDQWKRGQPVLISDVSKSLNKDLWSPTSFSRDFTDEKNDLINCMTGDLLPNQPMRKFWEGFECVSKRLRDDEGKSMLLKLKDWPPGEDFAEMMPTRFADLMQALPLADYTHRIGKLNLASRLPDCFVKPDLGPKMYIAYGSSALPSNKGTTNLHMDISDAVNVMVYVGIPRDGYNGDEVKEAFRAIDDAGCDILTRRRVRDKDELPGALWHIYSAQDADKIRDLLNKVAIERGDKLEPNHDPIHDQKWYLDGPLRERLYKEYHVEGYTIVQCLGDAIFIPAGAPHQVRNLHNCIKIAEDFVSPENISHCFHLMQEFRELSHQHSNHEDKLQIKNIIYHAVKDSLSVLSHAVVGGTATKEDPDTPSAPTAGSDSKGVSPTNGNSSVKTDPDN